MAIKVEKCGGIVLCWVQLLNITKWTRAFVHCSQNHLLHRNLKQYNPWMSKECGSYFDHVHLLKCMKNNWITQKCTKLTIDGVTYGFSYDVKDVYNSEKVNFLKTTPLIHMLQFTLQSCNFKMYITSFVFSTRRLLVLIVWWGDMRQQNLLNKSSNDRKFRMSLPMVKMAEWTTQTGQYKVPSLQTWLG